MWGLVVSAMTIAYSLVINGENSKKSGAAASSSDRHKGGTGTRALTSRRGPFESSSSRLSCLVIDDPFVSGAVLGMGVSLLVSSLSRRYALGERCKSLCQYLWNWERKSDAPYRKPTPYNKREDKDNADAAAYIQDTENGTIRRLVTPENTGTYRLHVSILTMKPGCEMPSQRARAIEFYHVLSGYGLFSQQGVDETASIRPGDCFVVDPGCMRWISNHTSIGTPGQEDLVLLRATDGGAVYSRRDFDTIRMDPIHHRRSSSAGAAVASAAIEVIKGSFKHAQIVVDEYIHGTTTAPTANGTAGGTSHRITR